MKQFSIFALSVLLFIVFLVLLLIRRPAYLKKKAYTMDTIVNTKEDKDIERKSTTMDANKAKNPGCKEKKLSQYKALGAGKALGKAYHHPSIVHYAKFMKSINYTETRLNFREYISVLSVYKFLKPVRLFFHTYTVLSGKYRDKIKSLKDVQVEVNVIPRVYKIGGKNTIYVQHQADYVKLKMVHRYGGTALDFDVIMINGTRWKHLQNRSECVLVKQTDTLNGGLYSCIQNSSFVSKWLEGYYKDYRPKFWLYNASSKPLYLLTDKQSKVCYNVHIDETVCLLPNWVASKEWLKDDGVQWENKTAAHYFIKTGIPNDGEGLLKEKFSLAELIKYVYSA